MRSKYIPTSFYLNPVQKQRVLTEEAEANLSLSEYLRRKVLGEDYCDETNAA